MKHYVHIKLEMGSDLSVYNMSHHDDYKPVTLAQCQTRTVQNHSQ